MASNPTPLCDCLHLLGQHRQQACHSFSEYSAWCSGVWLFHFFAMRKGFGLTVFHLLGQHAYPQKAYDSFSAFYVIFGSRCGCRICSLREGGLVCRSSVSACSPYIPNASEPITLFSQRVLCGAQHFQRHLWEFVAFVGLNCSTSGLTTTFGYSPF